MFTIFYCSISDRRPKRMFNVREVLDLLDNSDIEDFIISDEERQADSEDDYNPVHKLNNQRTKTFTDESSDESTDVGIPEPSTFESKNTHNRSEYRWKQIMFEPADSTFCGMQIEASEIKSPLSCFMEYFSDDIFWELAFETNQCSMLSSGISIKTTEQQIRVFWGGGVSIVMANLKFPRVRMYWAGPTEITSISTIMCLRRLAIIIQNIIFIQLL